MSNNSNKINEQIRRAKLTLQRWHASTHSGQQYEDHFISKSKQFRFYQKNMYVLNSKALLLQHWFFNKLASQYVQAEPEVILVRKKSPYKYANQQLIAIEKGNSEYSNGGDSSDGVVIKKNMIKKSETGSNAQQLRKFDKDSIRFAYNQNHQMMGSFVKSITEDSRNSQVKNSLSNSQKFPQQSMILSQQKHCVVSKDKDHLHKKKKSLDLRTQILISNDDSSYKIDETLNKIDKLLQTTTDVSRLKQIVIEAPKDMDMVPNLGTNKMQTPVNQQQKPKNQQQNLQNVIIFTNRKSIDSNPQRQTASSSNKISIKKYSPVTTSNKMQSNVKPKQIKTNGIQSRDSSAESLKNLKRASVGYQNGLKNPRRSLVQTTTNSIMDSQEMSSLPDKFQKKRSVPTLSNDHNNKKKSPSPPPQNKKTGKQSPPQSYGRQSPPQTNRNNDSQKEESQSSKKPNYQNIESRLFQETKSIKGKYGSRFNSNDDHEGQSRNQASSMMKSGSIEEKRQLQKTSTQPNLNSKPRGIKINDQIYHLTKYKSSVSLQKDQPQVNKRSSTSRENEIIQQLEIIKQQQFQQQQQAQTERNKRSDSIDDTNSEDTNKSTKRRKRQDRLKGSFSDKTSVERVQQRFDEFAQIQQAQNSIEVINEEPFEYSQSKDNSQLKMQSPEKKMNKRQVEASKQTINNGAMEQQSPPGKKPTPAVMKQSPPVKQKSSPKPSSSNQFKRQLSPENKSKRRGETPTTNHHVSMTAPQSPPTHKTLKSGDDTSLNNELQEFERLLQRDSIIVTSPPSSKAFVNDKIAYQSMTSEKKLQQLEKILGKYNFSPKEDTPPQKKINVRSQRQNESIDTTKQVQSQIFGGTSSIAKSSTSHQYQNSQTNVQSPVRNDGQRRIIEITQLDNDSDNDEQNAMQQSSNWDYSTSKDKDKLIYVFY